MLAEHRAGAARGAPHAVMLTLGTGIGGGLILGGRLYRGAGARGGAGHLVVDLRRRRLPGRLPRPRLPRGARLRHGDRTGGPAIAAEQPDSALGAGCGRGREITGGLVTELAHDGDEAAREVLARVGRGLGAGLTGLVNAFDPEVVVIGGGACGRRAAARAGPGGRRRARAAAGARERVRIVPAHFGDEAGMLGAALLALEHARAR